MHREPCVSYLFQAQALVGCPALLTEPTGARRNESCITWERCIMHHLHIDTARHPVVAGVTKQALGPAGLYWAER